MLNVKTKYGLTGEKYCYGERVKRTVLDNGVTIYHNREYINYLPIPNFIVKLFRLKTVNVI